EEARAGEDLLLPNAKEVIVVGTPLDEGAGGVVEVGGLVDDEGRIARAGDDGTLGTSESGAADGGAAGDAQHADIAAVEDRLGRLQCRVLDDGEQAVDADGLVDRLVE